MYLAALFIFIVVIIGVRTYINKIYFYRDPVRVPAKSSI